MKRKHGDPRAREAADERRSAAVRPGSAAETGRGAAVRLDAVAPPPPAVPDAVGARAAWTLAGALAVLALARCALAFLPTMWLWGPNVLAFVGYEPEEVSGFAFGVGLERIAILRHGLPDIRDLWANDLRFLRQF